MHPDFDIRLMKYPADRYQPRRDRVRGRGFLGALREVCGGWAVALRVLFRTGQRQAGVAGRRTEA